MTVIFSALCTSVDGYITGPGPSPEQPLGVGGVALFAWYRSGETQSRFYPSFRLHPSSARVFDAIAGRTGAIIAGRKTYDHANGWDGAGPHPDAALAVLSHRPAPGSATPKQVFLPDLAAAIKHASETAAGKDVALMGSASVNAALAAGLLDELIIHQVPIMLGGGTKLFSDTALRPLSVGDVSVAPDVTHMTYRLGV